MTAAKASSAMGELFPVTAKAPPELPFTFPLQLRMQHRLVLPTSWPLNGYSQ